MYINPKNITVQFYTDGFKLTANRWTCQYDLAGKPLEAHYLLTRFGRTTPVRVPKAHKHVWATLAKVGEWYVEHDFEVAEEFPRYF